MGKHKPSDETCAICDQPIRQNDGRGRPRRYCSVKCRNHAYMIAAVKRGITT